MERRIDNSSICQFGIVFVLAKLCLCSNASPLSFACLLTYLTKNAISGQIFATNNTTLKAIDNTNLLGGTVQK